MSLDSLDSPNNIEASTENEAPVLLKKILILIIIIENNGIEEDNFEVESFENINLEAQSLDNNDSEYAATKESNITPTAPLLFDDHTLLDNEFDTHTSTALSPVTPIEDESALPAEHIAETAEDFSSRFCSRL